MHVQTFHIVENLLGSRWLMMPKSTTDQEIDALRTSQRNLYQKAVLAAERTVDEIVHADDYPGLRDYLIKLVDLCVSENEGTVHGKTDGRLIEMNTPILTEEKLQKFQGEIITGSPHGNVFAAMAGAIIYESAAIKGFTEAGPPPAAVDAAIAGYASWKVHETTMQKGLQEALRGVKRGGLYDEFAASIAKVQEDIAAHLATRREAIDSELAALKLNVSDANASAQATIDRVAEIQKQAKAYSDTLSAQSADLEGRYKDTKKAVDNFIAAATARLDYKQLRIHWTNRSRTAMYAFAASSVLLFLLLIVVPVIALYNRTGIFDFMRELADLAGPELPGDAGPVHLTVATVGRLIIVTIPIALYFWLIRLVVRFNSRSLLLMDDAALRATMLETFYRMIEKDAAAPEDRGLVLSALMRPSPGHGNDPVEPPDFTDFMTKVKQS